MQRVLVRRGKTKLELVKSSLFFRERNDQDGNSGIKPNADGTVTVRGDRRVAFLVS